MPPELIKVGESAALALLGGLGTCILAWFNRGRLLATIRKDDADTVQKYQQTVSALLDEVNELRQQVAKQSEELAVQRAEVVRLKHELERGREEIMTIRDRLRICEEARGVAAS